MTVLFADVSGFTRMADRLDVEEVHDLMNEVFAGLGHTVSDEGGYIDKYIGDNIMALFGAPVAHEDDPARACRAALGMQDFLGRFSRQIRGQGSVELRLRIGINDGLVVAGGVGSDVKMQYTVMGDSVNVASRLESSAEPGTVLVSKHVYEQAADQFEFGPERQLIVKGKPDPIAAYELLRERRRIMVRCERAGLAPFVGRERELAILGEYLGKREATARWVRVVGDAGLGKSRLVREAVARSSTSSVLHCTATSATARRPFGLMRRLLHDALIELTGDLGWSDSAAAFGDALRAVGERLAPYAGGLWYIAAPSALPVEPPDPDPQGMRRIVERGVATFLQAMAETRPGLIVFLDGYDLSDEASTELLEALARQPGGLPLTLVTSSRAEPSPSGAGATDALHVQPLLAGESAELLDGLAPGAGLPDDLRVDILRRAAGVPLYVEELVRSLFDSGALERDASGVCRWTLDAAGAEIALPASLRSAMTSRLDRLAPDARELLCQCSVQGVEFDPDVATCVWTQPGRAASGDVESAAIESLLDDLRAQGMVSEAFADRPGRTWSFAQELMRETCYETLLRRDRRALHAGTADALCEIAGDRVRVAPELLAHHEESAERWSLAADASLRAGDRAADLFVNDEALERYERVVNDVERLESPAPHDLRATVLAHRGAARVRLLVGGYEAAARHARSMRDASSRPTDWAEADRLTATAFMHTGRTAEAEKLMVGGIEQVREVDSDEGVLGWLLYDLAQLHHRADRIADALRRLRECRLAAAPDDVLIVVRVDMLEGRIAHTEGRFADAAALYARAYESAERMDALSERARARNNMGNAQRDLGDYEAAEGYFEQALGIWERMGDVECIAGVHNNLGNLAMSRGEFDHADEHHRRSLDACHRVGNQHGAALAQTNLAVLAIERGEGEMAVSAAEAALATLGSTDYALLRGLALVILGEAQLVCEQPACAGQAFEGVLRDYDEVAHPLAVAGARRGLGQVALLGGDLENALDCTEQALATFERLNRAQEVARTMLGRAEILRRLGHRERARADVQRAYELFVSMRAAGDAERARRLHDELS